MKINHTFALAVALALIALMCYFVLGTAQGAFPFWRGVGAAVLCFVIDFFWIGVSGIAEEE